MILPNVAQRHGRKTVRARRANRRARRPPYPRLATASHAYTRPERYTIAVKVIDIFGNDTMTLVPVTVG